MLYIISIAIGALNWDRRSGADKDKTCKKFVLSLFYC